MIDLGDGWFRVECVAGGFDQPDLNTVRQAFDDYWTGKSKSIEELVSEFERPCLGTRPRFTRAELEQANQALSSSNQLFYERAESLRSKVADLEQQLAEVRAELSEQRINSGIAKSALCGSRLMVRNLQTQLDEAMKLLRELYSGWNLGRIELGTFHAAKELIEKYGGGE